MEATAVVLEEPKRLGLDRLDVNPPSAADIVVETRWSGISTGTERLLWKGTMPPFPGLGYPLVPGYETVGEVIESGSGSRLSVGDTVFVPGASCYKEARGLFGGASSLLVTSSERAIRIDEDYKDAGVLMALAATAYHAICADGTPKHPDLIVGHGVLGRLLARTSIALGGEPPMVWETNEDRQTGALGYAVLDPENDERRDYRNIYDVSGDASLIDSLIGRLAPGGEIVLAGFYEARPSFAFPPAFMKEARFRVSAEWRPDDLIAVRGLIEEEKLLLAELITHRVGAGDASQAYETAFNDPSCLKMILDWGDIS